jgi:hypothetical protein
MRREGRVYESFRDAITQDNLPKFVQSLQAEPDSNKTLLLLHEIFQRDEMRSVQSILEELDHSLETTFQNAPTYQLAGVFSAIFKRYPTANCGANDETFMFDCEGPSPSAKFCKFWADDSVWKHLKKCLEDSGRFQEIFNQIGEEERIPCLALFSGHGCGDKAIADWVLSLAVNDINATWRLVLKMVLFITTQVIHRCHGSDSPVILSILMTEVLEEYFCAFMHYIQDERPNWYRHVESRLIDDWLDDRNCKSCKEVNSMLRRGLRGLHEVDGQMLENIHGKITELLDLSKALDGALW